MNEITQHEPETKDTGRQPSGVAMLVVTLLLLTLIFLPIVVS